MRKSSSSQGQGTNRTENSTLPKVPEIGVQPTSSSSVTVSSQSSLPSSSSSSALTPASQESSNSNSIDNNSNNHTLLHTNRSSDTHPSSIPTDRRISNVGPSIQSSKNSTNTNTHSSSNPTVTQISTKNNVSSSSTSSTTAIPPSSSTLSPSTADVTSSSSASSSSVSGNPPSSSLPNRSHPSNVIQTTGSLNTTLSRKAAIPRRHLYRHYGRTESKVNIFTLAFQNTMLEKEYRSFMLTKGTKRTIWACVAFLICLIFFGVYEYYRGISGTGEAQFYIMVVRIITAALPFLYIILVATPSWRPIAFHDYMGTNVLETFMGTNFAVHGVLLVIAGSIGSYYKLPNFYPFAWWTSAYDLIHCAVTQLSGARFPVAASVALMHPLLLCINYILAGDTASLEGNIDQLLLLFACIISCLFVAYRREHIERKEFVSLLNVSADKRMREELISEMLPQKVKEMLQDPNNDQQPQQQSSRRLLANANNGNNNSTATSPNGNPNENDKDIAALRNLSVPLLVHIRAQFGRRSLNKNIGRIGSTTTTGNGTNNTNHRTTNVSPNAGKNMEENRGGSIFFGNRNPTNHTNSFHERVSTGTEKVTTDHQNYLPNDNDRRIKTGTSASSLIANQGSNLFDGIDEDANNRNMINRRSSTSSETGENNIANTNGDATHRIMNPDEERTAQRVRRTRTIRFAKRSSVLMDTVLATNLLVNGVRRGSAEETAAAAAINGSVYYNGNEETMVHNNTVNNHPSNASPNLPRLANPLSSNNGISNMNSFHLAPAVESISGKLASAQFGGRSVSVPRSTVGLGDYPSGPFTSASSSSSSSASSSSAFPTGRPPSATRYQPTPNRSQSVDPSLRSGRGSILNNLTTPTNNGIRGTGKRGSIESGMSTESTSDKSGDHHTIRRPSDGGSSRASNGTPTVAKTMTEEGPLHPMDNHTNGLPTSTHPNLKLDSSVMTPQNKGLRRYHRSSTEGYQSFWSPDGKDVHAFSEDDVLGYQMAGTSSSSSVDVSAHTGTMSTPKPTTDNDGTVMNDYGRTVSPNMATLRNEGTNPSMDDPLLQLSPDSATKIGNDIPWNKSSPLTLNLGTGIVDETVLPGTVNSERNADSVASSPSILPSSTLSGNSTGRSVRGIRELSGTARIITSSGLSEKAANWRNLRGSIVGELMLSSSPKPKEYHPNGPHDTNNTGNYPANNGGGNKGNDSKVTRSLSSQGSSRSFFGSSAWSFLQAPLSFRSDNSTNRSTEGGNDTGNNRSNYNILNGSTVNANTGNVPNTNPFVSNQLVRGPSISNVFRKIRRESRDSVHSDVVANTNMNNGPVDINMLRRSSTASGIGNEAYPFNTNIAGSVYYSANASGAVGQRYNIDGLDDNPSSDQAVGHNFSSVTVMFVYITNLNRLATKADPLELVTFLNGLYTEFDAIVDEIGVYKVMAIANMYMCVSGALDDYEDHAARMADTALAMMKLVKKYRNQLYLAGEPVRIQIGLHSGEAAGGVIGFKTFNWHIFGDTVNTASRMCSNNDPGRIQISPVTAEMIEIANKAHLSRNNTLSPLAEDHIAVPVTNDGTIVVSSTTVDPARTLTTPPKYILKERGLVQFKGKGEILTSWLTDSELIELDAVDTQLDENEKLERKRLRQMERKLRNAQHRQRLEDELLDNLQNTSDNANFVAKLRNLFGSTNPQSFHSGISSSTNSTKRRVAGEQLSATQRGQSNRYPLLDGTDDTTTVGTTKPKNVGAPPVRARRASLDGGRRGSNIQTHNGVLGALIALDPLQRPNSAQITGPRRASSTQTRRRSSLDIFTDENVAKLRETEKHKPAHPVVPAVPPLVIVVEPSHSHHGTNTDRDTHNHGSQRAGETVSHRSDASSDVQIPPTPKELQTENTNTHPISYVSTSKPTKDNEVPSSLRPVMEESLSTTGDMTPKPIVPKINTSNETETRSKPLPLAETTLAKGGTLKGTNAFSTDSKGLNSTAIVASSAPLFGTSTQATKAPFTPLTGKSVVEVDAASQRDRLVTLVEQPKHWLTLTFADPYLESRFQRSSQSELSIQLLRVFSIGTLVAIGALLKLIVFDDPALYNTEQVSALLLSRITLLAVCGVCALLMIVNCPGRMMNSLIYIRLFPCARFIPPHEQLSVLLCFAYSICLNAELYPISEWSSRSLSGLGNLNFVLLLTYSFVELRAYVLTIVNTLCWGIYAGLLISSQLTTDDDIAAHIFLAGTACIFSCMTAYVREISRRNRFTVQEQATRQRDRCEKLLLNMLPSQGHAEALMRGEHVVEVLEDVTMLYSDIKGFTELSAKLDPEELIKFLDHLYTAFDQHLDHFGLYKIETIGDAFIVVGGMKNHGDKAGTEKDRSGNGNGGKTTPVSSPSGSGPVSRRRSSLATFMTPAELMGWRSGTTAAESSENSSSGGGSNDGSGKGNSGPLVTEKEDKQSARVSFISRIMRSRGLDYPLPVAQGKKDTNNRSPRKVHKPSPSSRLFAFGSPSKVAPLPLSMVNEEQEPNEGMDEDDHHSPISVDGQRAVSTSLLMKRSLESTTTTTGTGSSSSRHHTLSMHGGEHSSETNSSIGDDHSYDHAVPNILNDTSGPRVSLSALAASGFSTEVAMAAERKQARRASILGGTGRAALLRTIMEGNSSASRANTMHGGTSNSTTTTNEYTHDHTKTMTEATLVTERSYDDLLHPSILPIQPTGLLSSHSSFSSTLGPIGTERTMNDDPTKPPPLYPSGRTTKPMSHAGAIAAFAMDMLAEVRRVRERTGVPVFLRVGIHSGKAVGGIIGKTRPRFFIWGADTLIANKMESSGVVSGIQVSEVTARRLVDEGFTLIPHQIVDVSPESDHHHGSGGEDDDEDDDEDAESITNVNGSSHLQSPPSQTVNTYLLVRYTDPSGMAFEVSNV